VANTISEQPEAIISGNERVLSARLRDAEFFFNTDCKNALVENLPKLSTVLFHKDLGSMYDKTMRVKCLATWIATTFGITGVNIEHVKRAALLSKCDLVTSMVSEFPDTQGAMGMHYAHHDGEVDYISNAIKEQYLPRFSGDCIPKSTAGCLLALADKIDTLVGIISTGWIPKGDKDPFALRRKARGLLRIILERNLPIDLERLAEKAILIYDRESKKPDTLDNTMSFLLDRLYSFYREQGYSTEAIKAVIVCKPTCLIEIDARIKAISSFMLSDQSARLTQINKRISKILDKSDYKPVSKIKVELMREREEIKLATFVTVLSDKLQPYFLEYRYREALAELAGLNNIVDSFFSSVMVNVEDMDTCINRLTILSKLRELVLQVGDISLVR
jgi:glycyl-tRNA synthetase beta chain